MDKSGYDYAATPVVVNMDVVGAVSVYVQGDLDKFREGGVVFMTVHTAGSSFNTWLDFAGDMNMEDIRKRSIFLHIALPGQTPGCEDLGGDFPTMDAIGLNLVTVLDHLRVKQVVGLGDGAGANIMLRFGMHHPTRVHGIIAINTDGIESAGLQEILSRRKSVNHEELNNKNVAKFIDAYKKRTEILSQLNAKIKFDALIVVGAKSKSCVLQAERMHQQIEPGLCSIIKVEDVTNPLLEAPEKVSEALILFCQGQGLMPTINRRASRQLSQGSDGQGRKMSMTDYDIPNIRRLSLTPRQTEEEASEENGN